MTRTDIISAIHQVLRETMFIPQIDAFSETARLNEDLYLDSVLILELILNLETDFGFDIPDDALTKDDFDTVASLAEFLNKRVSGDAVQQEEQAQSSIESGDEAPSAQGTTNDTTNKEPAETGTIAEVAEEFEDIKVHCFVSCICEMIKADPRVDHRPFYFGVWDAEVVVSDDFKLSYHSDTINHDFFKAWYHTLYGVEMHAWFNDQTDKAENIHTLLNLLDGKSKQRNVMVMLDMYRLPERENKFNQNPFPHYVLLEETDDPTTWFMTDPDFRWEGPLSKDKILNSIESPAVSGGYYFDSTDIIETPDQAVHDYFLACIKPDNNPMTDVVRSIINAHVRPDEASEVSLSGLSDALKQIPVLAIRKYAYEHGFAFFWRALELNDDDFEAWCVVIETLVETYKLIQYRAMKIAKSESPEAISSDSVSYTHLTLPTKA